jgi:hypothetical protein
VVVADHSESMEVVLRHHLMKRWESLGKRRDLNETDGVLSCLVCHLEATWTELQA